MSSTRPLKIRAQDLGSNPPALQDAKGAAQRISARVAETADALAEILRKGGFADRWSAAAVLGRMCTAAVERLVDALGDEDADVRWLAAFAISHHGSRACSAVPSLVEALEDHDASVRWAAAEALAAIGAAAPSAVESCARRLAERLLDDDHEVVRAGYGALRNLEAQAAAAIPILVDCMGHSDNYVRWCALSVVESIGAEAYEVAGRVTERLGDADAAIRRRALLALEAIGPLAFVDIIGLLDDPDPQVRRAVAESLARLGRAGSAAAQAAVPRLVTALGERSAATRAIVVQALGDFGPAAADAAPELARLLDDSRESVRHAVVAALGRIRSEAPEIVKGLVALLGSTVASADHQNLRAPAADALAGIGARATELSTPALDALRASIEDELPDVRAASTRALAEWGALADGDTERDILATLARRLGDECAEVREAAIDAIARLALAERDSERFGRFESIAETIDELCDSDDDATRDGAARVLARLSPDRARRSRHEACRLAACREACELGDLELLDRALEQSTPDREMLNSFLAHACRQGSVGCARRLLEAGADVNTRTLDGRTTLMLACESDTSRRELIDLLVSRVANVDAQDSTGATALIEAVSRQCADNVDVLLVHEANADIATSKHETALSFAIVWDRPDLVRRLLRSRADPNLQTPDGNTPLAHALGLRVNHRIVRLLLQHGANPDRGTICGTSFPIHALRLEDESLAIEFLTRSRNLDYRDSYGYTMLEFARSNDMPKVVKVLESLGAE